MLIFSIAVIIMLLLPALVDVVCSIVVCVVIASVVVASVVIACAVVACVVVACVDDSSDSFITVFMYKTTPLSIAP